MSRACPGIGLIVIATGRYDAFVPALVEGAKAHIPTLDRVFVLSDAPPEQDDLVTWLPWGHIHWPYPTLLRYRAMSAYRDVLVGTDLLVYLDVDMRIQRDIELPAMTGTLAVQHPGYVGVPPEELPYERRPESTSCIPVGSGERYFAGGIQGGQATAYLAACATIARWIQADLDNGLVPRWHDESAWNRYCALHPPSLVMPESYCSPEYHQNADAHVVALDKDHDALREAPRSVRLARALEQVKRRSIRVASRAAQRLRAPS